MRVNPGFRRLFGFLIAGAAAIALLVLADSWWLPGVAWALVRDDGPAKADMAVVLGGDTWGNRILRAGELVRQGYVPVALVSGPPGFYDQHECEPEIAYAVRHGYPAQYFIPFPDEARSTGEEAEAIIPELERRHVRQALIVTNDYHTRRALRIFEATVRRKGSSIALRVIAVPDREFHAGSWWRTRQGQKITFMEWSKTIATAIGL